MLFNVSYVACLARLRVLYIHVFVLFSMNFCVREFLVALEGLTTGGGGRGQASQYGGAGVVGRDGCQIRGLTATGVGDK